MAGKAQVPAAAQAREEEWPFERRSTVRLDVGVTRAARLAVTANDRIHTVLPVQYYRISARRLCTRTQTAGAAGGTIAGYQAVSAQVNDFVSTMASFLSRHLSFEEQGQPELRSECSNHRDPPTPPATVAPRRDLEAYLDQLSSSASHLDRPVVVLPPNFGTMVEDQMQLTQRAHAAARGEQAWHPSCLHLLAAEPQAP
jgi:hypothetical protein